MIAPARKNGELSPPDQKLGVDPVWRYSFVLRMAAGYVCSGIVQAVLEMAIGRVEVAATDGDFSLLRDELAGLGFEMYEIERVPYFEPETVL